MSRESEYRTDTELVVVVVAEWFINQANVGIIMLKADGYLPLNIIICVYFFCRFYQFHLQCLMESVNGTESEYSVEI